MSFYPSIRWDFSSMKRWERKTLLLIHRRWIWIDSRRCKSSSIDKLEYKRTICKEKFAYCAFFFVQNALNLRQFACDEKISFVRKPPESLLSKKDLKGVHAEALRAFSCEAKKAFCFIVAFKLRLFARPYAYALLLRLDLAQRETIRQNAQSERP